MVCSISTTAIRDKYSDTVNTKSHSVKSDFYFAVQREQKNMYKGNKRICIKETKEYFYISEYSNRLYKYVTFQARFGWLIMP